MINKKANLGGRFMDKFYNVSELKKNVYRIGSNEQVFMDLFVGTEKALLWDTGYGYGDLKAVIREITDLPLIIVNSHGHLDHTCGNFQFEEEIYIHPEDIELCQLHNSLMMRKGAVENGRHTFMYETGQMMDVLPADFDEERYVNAGYGKLVPVEEGHVFDLGGITLEVIKVPGHTHGSIGLLYKEEKIFYAGDAMNPFLWLFAPEATMLSEYKATLRKAEELNFEALVISHGPGALPKAVLADFMDAAEHVDYEKGTPFQSPLVQGVEARICAREGFGPQDMGKPGFASVVISREHID